MPPYVIMRPTMSGRPFLSFVASHSSVMVPELPGMVMRSACATPGQRTAPSRSAAKSLLAARTLVPGGDADTIARAGRADRLFEVHLVVRSHRAGDEAHALGRHAPLRIERLHQQARDAVAGFAPNRDDVPRNEWPALPV